MRLTFDCASAAKFPIVIESRAEVHTSGSQVSPIGSNAGRKTRKKAAKAAAFGPADRNAVTGVGAPWYTSGAHIWNGAAEILKPKPTSINAAAMPTSKVRGARSSP